MLLKLIPAMIACAALAAAAAQAGDPASDKPDPRLGEEVNSICFASSINGWKGLKGEDDVVLLERGVNDWYLVELAGMCRSRDFRSATTIGIESHPGGGCVTRGDIILVRAAGNFTKRCHITGMYKWDDDAPAPAEDDGEESETDNEDA